MNVYARYSVVQSISPQIKWASAGSSTMQPGTAKRLYHNWQIFGVGVDAIVWQNAGPTITPAPTTDRGLGGDDVPSRRRKSPDKGFDLEAWKAKQPDFEGTIRGAYESLMRGPVAEEVLDIVAPHVEVEDDSIDWQALFADYRALSELVQLHEAQMREEEAIVSLLIH